MNEFQRYMKELIDEYGPLLKRQLVVMCNAKFPYHLKNVEGFSKQMCQFGSFGTGFLGDEEYLGYRGAKPDVDMIRSVDVMNTFLPNVNMHRKSRHPVSIRFCAGIDEFRLRRDEPEEEVELKTMRCLIVIPYRVKIIIPEHEVFIGDRSTEYHMLHSMCGARISYVITHIDREEGFAIASRKLSLEKIRRASIRRMGKVGDVLAVGQNLCTVTYNGYAITVPQRDVSYGRIEDLRAEMLPGDVKKALITEYDADEKILRLTLKGATAHPFDGIETRHPLGSTRVAKIVGKYAGGVFCRLYDGVTTILCSYLSMQYDGDFREGDIVEVIINRYNTENKQVYGKILRKIGNQ